MLAKNDNLVVNAFPTKEFFISMLIRDIELVPAIADLIDNSLDGALRLRGTNKLLKGLWVRVNLDRDAFGIEDNCGGIPLDLAREYAFRFGRAEGMPTTKHSVGQFGVGMKRALFKLGKRFTISSTTRESQFELTVDVEKWRREQDWSFSFSNVSTKKQPDGKVGTLIKVDPLHGPVGETLGLANFELRLRKDIQARHQRSMALGLSIFLNGIPLNAEVASLKYSNKICKSRSKTVAPSP